MKMQKQKGSSLLIVLITAMTLLIITAGVAYRSKMDILTASSLDRQMTNRIAVTDGVNMSLQNGEFSTVPSSWVVGSNTYTTTVDNSGVSLADADEGVGYFSPGNVEMGYSQVGQGSGLSMINISVVNTNSGAFVANKQAVISGVNVTGGQQNQQAQQNFMDVYTPAFENNDDRYPINIPFVDVANLTAGQLNNQGELTDTQTGYVGAILLDPGSGSQRISLVNAAGTRTTITPPSGYQSWEGAEMVGVGYELVSGEWFIHIALAYESLTNNFRDVVYVSRFSLDNLENNSNTAVNEIETSASILRTDLGGTVEFRDMFAATLGFANGTNGIMPFVLERSGGMASMLRHAFEFDIGNNEWRRVLTSLYDRSSDRFTYHVLPIINVQGGATVDEVVIVSDVENLSDTRVAGINGVNYSMVVTPVSITVKPVMVENDGQRSLVTAQGTNLVVYNYDNTAVNPTDTLTTPRTVSVGANVVKLMVKFGHIFVVTSTQVRAYDWNLNNEQNINISDSSDIEILYDNDNSVIYALPDALNCRMFNNCSSNDMVSFTAALQPTISTAGSAGQGQQIIYIRDN